VSDLTEVENVRVYEVYAAYRAYEDARSHLYEQLRTKGRVTRATRRAVSHKWNDYINLYFACPAMRGEWFAPRFPKGKRTVFVADKKVDVIESGFDVSEEDYERASVIAKDLVRNLRSAAANLTKIARIFGDEDESGQDLLDLASEFAVNFGFEEAPEESPGAEETDEDADMGDAYEVEEPDDEGEWDDEDGEEVDED
jgi:hypothetical protein